MTGPYPVQLAADFAPVSERILDRLPVHVRTRDEASGGLLRALADAIGAELELLERDTDELYASWFIETCPEWVVPYLADLLGVPDLPPDLSGGLSGLGGVVASRRAFVANTVAYRRRKGTVAVFEQVARDATGWPAAAVEYYRLLAASTHVNHVHLERPATARVRTPVADAGPLELLPDAVANGALGRAAHTVEVRRIASGRGRYGIRNVGVFLFPDLVYESGWAPARPPAASGGGWSVDPLRLRTPLYALPAAEDALEHLAAEPDLPVPLRPRRLLALLTAARRGIDSGASLPVGVSIDGAELDPSHLRVCGLEDLATEPSGVVLPGWQVMVDAVNGRLFPFESGTAADPPSLRVRHSYGGTADVGAGTYDRTAVHQAALAADPYRGDPDRGGRGTAAQVVVSADADAGVDVPGPVLTTVANALEFAENAWAGLDSPAGATFVVAVVDSSMYAGDLAVTVPASTRLIIVAAAPTGQAIPVGSALDPAATTYATAGVRPHIAGTLTVTGGGGSSVVLDGLVVEGDLVVTDGALGSLTVSQCTVAGRLRIGTGAAGNPGIAVACLRSVTGAVVFPNAAGTLRVDDGVIDAAGPAVPPSSPAAAIDGAGVHAGVTGSTIRGGVQCRTLSASSAIFDGPVLVEHRQVGCVRYSFVEPGARVPRRFRCAPGPGADVAMRPGYESVYPGSPRYLALAPGCALAIAEGGEGGAEMGVHHHLARPVRMHATRRLLQPYLPVGLELGVTRS